MTGSENYRDDYNFVDSKYDAHLKFINNDNDNDDDFDPDDEKYNHLLDTNKLLRHKKSVFLPCQLPPNKKIKLHNCCEQTENKRQPLTIQFSQPAPILKLFENRYPRL